MAKRTRQAGLASLVLLAAATAADDSSVLQNTQTTLAQWVETRQLISRTRVDWKADEEMLQRTVAMFEGELASLAEQARSVGTNSVEVARQRTQAEAQKADLEAGLAVLAQVLGPLEQRLRQFAAVLPPPLLKTVQSLVDRLPAEVAATEAPPLKRLQTVITLLNEIEKFNAMVTLSPEMRPDPTGGEIKVQVLYLGLGQAWFVDEAGAFAGSGVPGPNGWEWTPQPDLGPRIKRVMAMYEEKQPAEFVALPVEIK